MATEHNRSVYLVCDHNRSFGAMATEYNDSVHLVCICDRHGSEHNGLVDLVCDRFGSEYNDSDELLCCEANSRTSIHSRGAVCCSSDADVGLSTCSWSSKNFPDKALTSCSDELFKKHRMKFEKKMIALTE